MEGSMQKPFDSKIFDNKIIDFDDRYGFDGDLDFNRGPDTAGYWFLAAVLFAFIAAGVIVYRAGNADTQTAANYSSNPVAQSDPVAPQIALPR
jgi:hypothetical protein